MTPIDDPCEECEEMMQPFLDGSLSEEEVAAAQTAPRRLQLVREAVQVRGAPASLRARRGQ